MSIADALKAKTLELRKTRDELAGAFQGVQALAIASAKERALKGGDDTVTDDDAVRAINKSIKAVRDMLALVPDNAKSLRELEALEALLPSLASEDEIRTEAEVLVAALPEKNMKQMGIVMGQLSVKFGASLDKGKASAVVKAVLSA